MKIINKKIIFTLYSILFGFSFLIACQTDPLMDTSNANIPSRYDQITIEKIQIEDDKHPPILHSDIWEQPRPVEGTINSAGLEDSPFITPDGKTMFFFYTPSADIPAEGQLYDGVTGIYLSKKVNGIWQEPERLTLNENENVALDGCPFYQDDILWFCSIRADNYRDIDFWTGKWNGANWEQITNVGSNLNQDIQIGEMHISPDGQTLYFHKQDENNVNGYELWFIPKVGDGWGHPEIMTNINSSTDDSRPALNPNGSELWFTRTHNGTPAIFRSQLVNGNWEDPELIISQFAGEPSIDGSGNIYFTHHYFEENKMLEADIYIAQKKQ